MKKLFIYFPLILFLFIISSCSKSLIPAEEFDDAYYLKKIRSSSDNLDVHRSLIETYNEKGSINIPLDIYNKAVINNPENPIVFYALGYTYLIEGSPEALSIAQENLKTALELSPEFPDALSALGDYYLATGNEELALENWRKARQFNEKFAPAYLSLARYYRSKKEYTRAEEEYEDGILWSSGGKDKAYLELGTMYMEMNDLERAEEMMLKARGENPRSGIIHYKLGQLYAIQDKRDDAIRSYRSGRKFDPDNSQAAYDLAYIFLEKNDLKYAMLSFERGLVADGLDEATSKELISNINKGVSNGIDYLAQLANSSQSKNFDLIYVLGKLYLAQKNEKLALQYFQQASSLPNTNADVHYQLGLLYEKSQPKVAKSDAVTKPKSDNKQDVKTLPEQSQSETQQPETPEDIGNVQEQYRKAVDMGSSEADLLFRVAQGYLDEGQEDKFVEVAEKALAINSNNLDFHLKLADIYLRRAEEYRKNSKPDEENKAILKSVEHYEQVTMLGPDAQRWYNLGMLYERAGKSRAVKAIRAYEQAIQIKPDYAMAYYRRGNFMLNYKVGPAKVLMYKPEVAIEDLKKAVELDPNLSDAHLALGMAYHQKDMPEMATEQFEKAVQTDPKNVRAHIYLAQDYALVEENQKVIAHLSAAAELAQDNAEVLKMFGGMLLKYGTDGDVPKAREALRKANDLKPDDPEILMNFGYTLYLAKMFDEAIKMLERSIELQPIYPEAHYNLALAYSRTGEYELARDHWEKVIKQAPDSSIAQKAADFISKMEKDGGR